MTLFSIWRSGRGAAGLLILCGSCALGQNEAGRLTPGLLVEFSRAHPPGGSASDIQMRPNVWLHVPQGQAPTPFLPPGAFSAVWTGFVSVDLRSEYRFQAELNGAIKVEINGVTVLEASSQGGRSEPGKAVRLNKGTNAITAAYTSPEQGDAWVRLEWIPRRGLPSPIPLQSLSRDPETPAWQKASSRDAGRELVLERRCLKCHQPAQPGESIELKKDAPSFAGMGRRRQVPWMAEWILDPQAQRPSATMPRLPHGPQAKADAAAMAAYLGSLLESTPLSRASRGEAGQAEAGKVLFDQLQCAACHMAPGASDKDSTKVSLAQVRRKFAEGALADFLLKPEAHFEWIRMPNFQLSQAESSHLAAYLLAHAAAGPEAGGKADSALLERGQKLVQTKGCLNCHSHTLENRFAAPAWESLDPERWNNGCLAEKAGSDSKAPWFGFNDAERKDLQNFAASDRLAATRFVSSEFAGRQMRNLNCRECHGQMDGIPRLDLLGGKIRPEWARQFLAGDVKYKPRPWIAARMPAFPAYAQGLAQGMAQLHGYPPATAQEDAIDPEKVRAGQKLISADGGFSCIACHAVGNIRATAVFESEGINLAYSAERLLKPYFYRWIYNPLAIEPATKMPVYFDEEGQSPLFDVLNGEGAAQIEAMWHYMRLGDKMPAPLGMAPAP